MNIKSTKKLRKMLSNILSLSFQSFMSFCSGDFLYKNFRNQLFTLQNFYRYDIKTMTDM